MAENKDISKKKYEIYESLFNSNSIEEILKCGENCLNNPIFVLDTSYKIIAKSPLSALDQSSIECIDDDEYLKLNVVELMKKEKCIDNIFAKKKAFFHHGSDIFIFCSINIDNCTTSYIAVLQSKTKFQDEDLAVVNALSNVLAVQIQNENLFLSSSGLSDEYYLANLLTKDINDVDYIKDRLISADFKIFKNNLIISIPYSQVYMDYRHNFAVKHLINSIKNILPNAIATYYEHNLIFIMSCDDFNVIDSKTYGALNHYLKLNNLVCGISMTFSSLEYIRDYYYQAIYANDLSLKVKKQDTINYFTDYAADYLFYSYTNLNNSSIKHINPVTLINPLINKLIKYDDLNNSCLFMTFKTYLNCNRNSNEAAQKLSIHKSTFFYRFHKIKEILKIDITDSSILYKLESSIKLLNYLNS